MPINHDPARHSLIVLGVTALGLATLQPEEVVGSPLAAAVEEWVATGNAEPLIICCDDIVAPMGASPVFEHDVRALAYRVWMALDETATPCEECRVEEYLHAVMDARGATPAAESP